MTTDKPNQATELDPKAKLMVGNRVAIIGAGMAGVTCALQLERLGAAVTLFDKSRGASGRMSTRRGSLSGSANADAAMWQYDHGAQYFVASDAAFQAQVLRWQAAGLAAPWRPTIAVLGASTSTSVLMPGGETVRDSAHAMAVAKTRWVGTPRMSSVVSQLAKTLRGQVLLESTVNALTHSSRGWQLATLERGAVSANSATNSNSEVNESFDSVLVALPAPQAHALLQTAGAAGEALATVAASQPMQACWSVMLHLGEALALDFDAAAIGAGPLGWIARDNGKPDRPSVETWVLHASAEWSAASIEASAEFVMATLIDAFSGWAGSTVKPLQAVAHRWRYARAGAICDDANRALTTAPCFWQPENRLGMCGDWLAGGTVEGAWLSGMRLADIVKPMP